MKARLLAVLTAGMVVSHCGGSTSVTPTPTPASTYTVGVTVTGLSGTVVLQDNGVDELSPTADGSFTFTTALANSATYAVTILTQPTGQTCTLANASGTIASANVTNVTVTCVSTPDATYTVSATVSGLTGTVVLQDNGVDNLSPTANGSYTFATKLSNSAAYLVTILTQPVGQTCTVSNGSGTIAAADVTNVTVSCVTLPTPSISGITVAGGNAVTSPSAGIISSVGTTNVSTSTSSIISATFSEIMNTSTANTSNVTLTCNGTQQTITVSTSSQTTFTITPTSTALPQLRDCTLSFGTGILSAQGMPLASATSYVFTTGCSTNDNFSNPATPVGDACWTTVPSTVGSIIPTISSGALGFTFGSAFAFPGYTTASPVAYKTFANIPVGFTATVQATNSGPNFTGCAMWIATTSSNLMNQNAFITINGDGSSYVGSYRGTINIATTIVTAPSYICLKVNADGSVNYGNAPSADTCNPTSADTQATSGFIPVGGPAVVFLSTLSQGAPDTTCTFDNFTVTGASATGQD